MRWVTVRLTQDSWERLQAVCQVDELSARSAIESTAVSAMNAIETIESEPQFVLGAVVFLTAVAQEEGRHTRKVGIRMDESLVKRLKGFAKRYDVSVNKVLAATCSSPVQQWRTSSGDWGPIAETARRDEYQRRTAHRYDQ